MFIRLLFIDYSEPLLIESLKILFSFGFLGLYGGARPHSFFILYNAYTSTKKTKLFKTTSPSCSESKC